MKRSIPLSTPPEGVVAGEDVPIENQEEQFKENEIEKMMSILKMRGEPYTDMKDSELRERAVEKLEVIS